MKNVNNENLAIPIILKTLMPLSTTKLNTNYLLYARNKLEIYMYIQVGLEFWATCVPAKCEK